MTRPSRTWRFLLALAAQNVTIFGRHYFGTAGIPWDFSMAYYAMVAFWTSLVRDGLYPQWLPFQQMGYPFALQIQSGMNYLPLWILPALSIPYTLRAAIVVQEMHVLAGAIGMFVLARHVHGSKREALVAAVAFQCFGGFYSNAEHVDIVRAFAWAPWLLYVFALDRSAMSPLPARAWFIPPVLWFFLTAAYPGNVIAGGVVIGLYLVLQGVDLFRSGLAPVRVAATGARVVALALIGLGLASVHLGPIVLFRDQFVRAAPSPALPRFGVWVEHMPGLFLSNATLPGEISMTSTFVTMPVLVFASLASWASITRLWVLVAVGLAAVVLAAGEATPVDPFLRSLVPTLGLSRFPSSDYRVFVALPLMLLAVAGARDAAAARFGARSLLLRAVFIAAWFVWASPPCTRTAA